MLELAVPLGAYEHFNTEKTVHGCLFGCNMDRVLTPPDRMRLKKDDMLIEGPMVGLAEDGKCWAAQARGSR